MERGGGWEDRGDERWEKGWSKGVKGYKRKGRMKSEEENLRYCVRRMARDGRNGGKGGKDNIEDKKDGEMRRKD